MRLPEHARPGDAFVYWHEIEGREVVQKGKAPRAPKNYSEAARLVLRTMQSGHRTLSAISTMSGIPEATVSARIRDLRRLHGHDIRTIKRRTGYEYVLA